MTAIVAIADHAHLVKLRAVLLLCGPLPRVFTAVGEEDVGAGGVKATLIDGCLVGLRVVGHVQLAKGVRAELREVGLVNDGAAHGMLSAHCLEPTVLSAVLECPRATTAASVNLGASDFRSIIVYRGIAVQRAVLD